MLTLGTVCFTKMFYAEFFTRIFLRQKSYLRIRGRTIVFNAQILSSPTFYRASILSSLKLYQSSRFFIWLNNLRLCGKLRYLNDIDGDGNPAEYIGRLRRDPMSFAYDRPRYDCGGKIVFAHWPCCVYDASWGHASCNSQCGNEKFMNETMDFDSIELYVLTLDRVFEIYTILLLSTE